MPINKNITFNLSRGNPNNDPCGIGLDKQVFGKSLGGKFFDEEELGNRVIYKHNLTNGTYDVFDSIVPSDFIKSNVNYRVVYVTNRSISEYIPLDEITISDVSPDPLTALESGVTQEFAVSNVEIAIEGVYAIKEVMRPIPNAFGKPGNPSIYINDEYDSTDRLRNLEFKKIFSGNELPFEIPPESVLKVWIKRTVVVDKENIPEVELNESVTLTINESGNSNETSLLINYNKLKGRLPLSNWYDYTITLGNTGPIVMKELLPKEVDLSFNFRN